jgi:hypothetical protein
MQQQSLASSFIMSFQILPERLIDLEDAIWIALFNGAILMGSYRKASIYFCIIALSV